MKENNGLTRPPHSSLQLTHGRDMVFSAVFGVGVQGTVGVCGSQPVTA